MEITPDCPITKERFLEIIKESGGKWFPGNDSLVIGGKYGSGDGKEFVSKFAQALWSEFNKPK
jgi:hypothetical protein